MNRIFTVILIFLIVSGSISRAQDLIVTNEGDSLNCKILSRTSTSILYSYKEDGDMITRELPVNLFKSIIARYYLSEQKKSTASMTANITKPQSANANSEHTTTNEEAYEEAFGAASKPKTNPSPEQSAASNAVVLITAADLAERDKSEEFSKWFMGFRGGYANRLFRMGNRFTPGHRDYLKGLKSGYSIGVDGGYFLWKSIGLGLNADLYRSVARMKDDSRDDNVSLKYIGPSVMHRKIFEGGKSALTTGFTVGYQTFVNKGQEKSETFELRAKAIGWGANVGMDYKISPHAAISFSAACLLGTAYRVTKKTRTLNESIRLSKDNFEDLSRLSLTVGLRFL